MLRRSHRARLPVLVWHFAVAGMLGCGSTESASALRGRFTLTVAGAVDTTVTGGPATWTDLSNAGESSVEHSFFAWADGSAPVLAVALSMLRGTTARDLEPGATFRRGEGTVLSPTVWLACPPGSVGTSSCSGQFGARQGAPAVLTLDRVERDTIGGVLEFEGSGWRVGEPSGASPPDSVTVRLEFVMPRRAEGRRTALR